MNDPLTAQKRFTGPQPDWPEFRRCCVREARRYSDSPAQTEDIAQDALLRAWRRWGTCRQQDAPWAWLRQITRREALRALSRPRTQHFGDAGEPPEREQERTMEDAVQQRLTVDRALQNLTDRDRELVTLRFEQDLSYVAIGELLKVPAATVRVRGHRIMRSLRTISGEHHLA